MGKKIRVILALIVIIGVAYWAIDGVRERSYSGSRLSFDVGGGQVLVNNLSKDPIPVEMRTQGRTSSFRIVSSELALKETSKRQGSGSNAYHAINFELPPGQALIDVSYGSGVTFAATGKGRLAATVTPMSPESARVTLGFAGIVILVALYYLSAVLEHRWFRGLIGKLPGRSQQPKSAVP